MLFLIVLIASTLLGIIAAFAMIIHTYFMFRETNPKKHGLVNLIPFLAFAFPGTLTPKGEYHRFRMLCYLAVSLVCIGLALMLQEQV
jgi:cyanate permease